jgi:hypothetical protein
MSVICLLSEQSGRHRIPTHGYAASCRQRSRKVDLCPLCKRPDPPERTACRELSQRTEGARVVTNAGVCRRFGACSPMGETIQPI